MALLGGQQAASLDTLYQCEQVTSGLFGQKNSNIFINSGTVDVYHSNSATQPTALSDMVLSTDDTAIGGATEFNIVPKYIAIVQNTGTTTEIVLSSVKITSLGAIS